MVVYKITFLLIRSRLPRPDWVDTDMPYQEFVVYFTANHV